MKLYVTRFARASSPGVTVRVLAHSALIAAMCAVTLSARVARVAPVTVARTAAFGRITGTVEFDGPAPVDSVTRPAANADVCGASFVDVSLEHRGQRLGRAIVWVVGVTGGKQLPYVRRFDVLTQGCRVVPRVQTAIAGGTLDVRNGDAVTHRMRFLRVGSDSVLGVVSETEPGEVVPTRGVLAAPGLVEVRCDHHPWIHGWIAVFGHPYYATTDANGTFTIDSVPPGRYAITAWHERFGSHTDSVTVTRDGTANLTLRFARP